MSEDQVDTERGIHPGGFCNPPHSYKNFFYSTQGFVFSSQISRGWDFFVKRWTGYLPPPPPLQLPAPEPKNQCKNWFRKMIISIKPYLGTLSSLPVLHHSSYIISRPYNNQYVATVRVFTVVVRKIWKSGFIHLYSKDLLNFNNIIVLRENKKVRALTGSTDDSGTCCNKKWEKLRPKNLLYGGLPMKTAHSL